MAENSRYFNQPPTHEDTASQYESDLKSILAEHETSAGAITHQYEKDLTVQTTSPNQAVFESVLHAPSPLVSAYCARTTKSVDSVIKQHAGRFVSAITSNHDKAVWEDVRREFKEDCDVGSYFVSKALSCASDNTIEMTMRAALDVTVWQNVQRTMKESGDPNDYFVQKALKSASSLTVASSMRAALDTSVWKNVQAAIKESADTNDYFVQKALKGASGLNIALSMISAINTTVWQNVQRTMKESGDPNDYFVQKALKGASSSTIASLMEGFLPKPKPRKEYASSYEYSYDDDPLYGVYTSAKTSEEGDVEYLASLTDVELDQELQQRFRKSFIFSVFNAAKAKAKQDEQIQQERDRINAYRTASVAAAAEQARLRASERARQRAEEQARQRQQDRTRHDTGAGQNGANADSKIGDPDLESIIAKAASADRQFAWLGRADRAQVKAVIDTVKAARAKAAEKGEIMSDRDLYLRYRKSVDKAQGPMSDAERAKHKQKMQAYQIFEALIGGNIKGKLPF